MRDICAIIASEEFARRVELLESTTGGWVAGCRGFAYATHRPATAAGVVAAARNLPDFNLSQTEFARRSTMATTRLSDRMITVRTSRLAAATTGGVEARAALVGTLSHEMMHLVAAEGDAAAFRYADSGQWSPFCPRSRLVSYGVEGIVTQLWRERQSA